MRVRSSRFTVIILGIFTLSVLIFYFGTRTAQPDLKLMKELEQHGLNSQPEKIIFVGDEPPFAPRTYTVVTNTNLLSSFYAAILYSHSSTSWTPSNLTEIKIYPGTVTSQPFTIFVNDRGEWRFIRDPDDWVDGDVFKKEHPTFVSKKFNSLLPSLIKSGTVVEATPLNMEYWNQLKAKSPSHLQKK